MADPSRQFQLLIKPAGPRCNLACRYCFYSHDLEPDSSLPVVMADDVLETMIRKFLALGMPMSILCWQGGEPTLAGIDFFRRVVELEKQYGSPGQVVSNALQTNGQLIDDEWAELLAEYRFLVGLSIDGPAEVNDAQRVDARGRGSLAGALRAAELFDSHAVEYNILTVIHSGNQDMAREIFQWQLAHGWRHLQYIPCVEADSRGKLMPWTVSPEGYGRFLCDLWQAYLDSGRRDVGIRTFDSWLSQKVVGDNTLCTVSKRCGDYMLVKPDGGLFPCDFFFQDKWRLGNLIDDDLPSRAGAATAGVGLAEVFAKVRVEKFGHLKGRWADECAACRWVDLCNGGCPKDRAVCGDPAVGGRSYLCEGYKLFFNRHNADLDRLAADIRRRRKAGQLRRGQAKRRARAAGAGPTAVGRNDPCPCGSGRKFKRCCGR